MDSIQKIAPCLWFDSQGEDAAKFCRGVFTNFRIVKVSQYTNVGSGGSGAAPRDRS